MTRLSPRLLLTAPLLLALEGCDLDWTETVTRDLGAFHGISVANGIDVVLHKGDKYSVTIKTDSGDPDGVSTEIERGMLKIGKAHDLMHFFALFNWWAHYNVEVTMPSLDTLVGRGGSNIVADGDFAADRLEVFASGGSDIKLSGNFASLVVSASGGSDLKLDGKADRFEARVSGGSDIAALHLEARQADLRASGGSDIELTVLDTLKARASGGGDISYAGNPANTDINASGGADITARH